MAEMGRYEMRNYGPTTGLILNGVWMNFWAGSLPQYTDDPVLARLAGDLQYVEVIDTEPEKPLDEMTSKELIQKAKGLGLSSLSRKPKTELIEQIMSAEEVSKAPAGMEV